MDKTFCEFCKKDSEGEEEERAVSPQSDLVHQFGSFSLSDSSSSSLETPWVSTVQSHFVPEEGEGYDNRTEEEEDDRHGDTRHFEKAKICSKILL